MKVQEDFLDMLEEKKDLAEQNELKESAMRHQSANVFRSRAPPETQKDNDIEMSNIEVEPDDEGDEIFMKYLHELQEGDSGGDIDNEINNESDVEDDAEEEELDAPKLNHYLPSETSEGIGPAQRVMGTYVRVVHTNGIHTIAMISCECQGHEVLPCDLIAARLLPTSFERIRTLFSAQLLDYFRLSNLETKATAYQFYHLLQRLTNPMEPATVVNLYREFRRMARIWRWMKRLKWAGYGNKIKYANEVLPGELSVFCPACPQPSINIPENWKDDPAR